MNIPDKAIEAARALKITAGDVDNYTRKHGVDYMEALWLIKIEAAAPFIAAQALREVADAEQEASEDFARSLDMYDEDDPIPAAVMVESLRERAEELDPR